MGRGGIFVSVTNRSTLLCTSEKARCCDFEIANRGELERVRILTLDYGDTCDYFGLTRPLALGLDQREY